MNDTFPRPAKLFVAISVVVIAGNLLLVSTCIALIAVPLDGRDAISSVFLLPFCILVAVQQYRGTFRRVASAAAMTGVFLQIVGGLLLLAFLTALGEVLLDGYSLSEVFGPLLGLIVLAGFITAAGRMNWLWSRELRELSEYAEFLEHRRTFSLAELLAFVGAVAAMMAITSQLIRYAPPSYAENVDASAVPIHLPPGARNVCYSRADRDTIALEFTIDESAFRDWVNSDIGSSESQSANIPIREIVAPFSIPRYHNFSTELDGPDQITIVRGLYHTWSNEDRGVHAAFNRTTGRAYYFAHFH